MTQRPSELQAWKPHAGYMPAANAHPHLRTHRIDMGRPRATPCKARKERQSEPPRGCPVTTPPRSSRPCNPPLSPKVRPAPLPHAPKCSRQHRHRSSPPHPRMGCNGTLEIQNWATAIHGWMDKSAATHAGRGLYAWAVYIGHLQAAARLARPRRLHACWPCRLKTRKPPCTRSTLSRRRGQAA